MVGFLTPRLQALFFLYFSDTLYSQINQLIDRDAWRGAPARQPNLHWIPRAYHWFSTCVHSINLLLVLALKMSLIDKLGAFRCQWMPMVGIHESIPVDLMQWFCGLFSLVFIGWRATIQFYSKELHLDALTFLLLTSNDGTLMDGRGGDGGSRGEQETPTNGRPPKFIIRSIPGPRNRTDETSTRQAPTKNGVHSVLESLLYFNHSDKWALRDSRRGCTIKLALRSNRTDAARGELERTLWNGFVCLVLLVIGAFCLIVPTGLRVILMRHNYLYPKCPFSEPIGSIEEALAHPFYIRRVTGSLIFSGILLVDSVLVTAITGPLTALITRDLLICWRNISLKLNLILAAAQLDACSSGGNTGSGPLRIWPPCFCAATTAENRFKMVPLGGARRRPNLRKQHHLYRLATSRRDKSGSNRIHANKNANLKEEKEEEKVEDQIYGHFGDDKNNNAERHQVAELYENDGFLSLKVNLTDFMAQLERANGFMSKLLTAVILMWFSFNFVLTFQGLQVATTSSGMLWVRVVQLLAFCTLNCTSYLILRLRTETSPAYGQLCSLAALNRGPEQAARWLPLLAFYSGPRKLYGFTLWPSENLFTRLTCLKIMAYTASLMFFYETYKGHGTGEHP